jgi:hypothetical protein
MNAAPKWFTPVAFVALLWNLVGCLAFAADLSLSQADVAAMPEAQQALYTARPLWALIATGAAVLGGALGCVGLMMKRTWAKPLFLISLLGLVVQDIGLFVIGDTVALAGPAPLIMQGIVFVIAVGLLLLAHKAQKNGWLKGEAAEAA